MAGLWASEVAIYGRFGFGPATSQYDAVEVERRHGAFARPFTDRGRIRLIAAEDAAAVLPAVHERARLLRAGDVSRPDSEWRFLTALKRLAETFMAVHEDAAGSADGYALYKIDKHWAAGVPGNTLQCEELMWATPEAHAALWRFLLDVDLVAKVRVALRPLDEPVRWLLADPRRASFGPVLDGLWLALLDVPAALAARSYAADGTLVLEVDGRVLRLEAADGAAILPAGRRGSAELAAQFADAGRGLPGRTPLRRAGPGRAGRGAGVGRAAPRRPAVSGRARGLVLVGVLIGRLELEAEQRLEMRPSAAAARHGRRLRVRPWPGGG